MVASDLDDARRDVTDRQACRLTEWQAGLGRRPSRHGGLGAGAATARGRLQSVTADRREVDLREQAATDCFADETPQVVFLAAANVGGILANNTSGRIPL